MRLSNKKAVAVIEYAVLFIVVISAFLMMQKYLQRGIHGGWAQSGKSFAFGRQYDSQKVIECGFDDSSKAWYDKNCADFYFATKPCHGDAVCEEQIIASGVCSASYCQYANGGTPPLIVCNPTTCTPLHQCGSAAGLDDCGGHCNVNPIPTCPSPQTCDMNTANPTYLTCIACTPTKTCLSQGFNCGGFTDDCGQPQTCGTCTPPSTCTAGNVCTNPCVSPHCIGSAAPFSSLCPGSTPSNCTTPFTLAPSCTGIPCQMHCNAPYVYFGGACCLPTATCTAGGFCGANSNGCGGACACPAPQTCGAGNICQACTCPNCPLNGNCGAGSCACPGFNCTCTGGQTCLPQGNCIPGGQICMPFSTPCPPPAICWPNGLDRCTGFGCTPTHNCGDPGFQCGTFFNGCATVTCPANICGPSAHCSGTTCVPNGCTPTTPICPTNGFCGSGSNGCPGGTCTCQGGQTCQSNTCQNTTCTPTTPTCSPGGSCAPGSNGCPGQRCNCPGGQTCDTTGSNTCKSCGCGGQCIDSSNFGTIKDCSNNNCPMNCTGTNHCTGNNCWNFICCGACSCGSNNIFCPVGDHCAVDLVNGIGSCAGDSGCCTTNNCSSGCVCSNSQSCISGFCGGCTPTTPVCSLNGSCGPGSNGCPGGVCTCQGGQTCQSGTCQNTTCTPTTPVCPVGGSCGPGSNGCPGGVCTCQGGETCIGGICKFCETSCPGGMDCGNWINSCGTSITCGPPTCPPPQTCTNNVCGCGSSPPSCTTSSCAQVGGCSCSCNGGTSCDTNLQQCVPPAPSCGWAGQDWTGGYNTNQGAPTSNPNENVDFSCNGSGQLGGLCVHINCHSSSDPCRGYNRDDAGCFASGSQVNCQGSLRSYVEDPITHKVSNSCWFQINCTGDGRLANITAAPACGGGGGVTPSALNGCSWSGCNTFNDLGTGNDLTICCGTDAYGQGYLQSMSVSNSCPTPAPNCDANNTCHC